MERSQFPHQPYENVHVSEFNRFDRLHLRWGRDPKTETVRLGIQVRFLSSFFLLFSPDTRNPHGKFIIQNGIFRIRTKFYYPQEIFYWLNLYVNWSIWSYSHASTKEVGQLQVPEYMVLGKTYPNYLSGCGYVIPKGK